MIVSPTPMAVKYNFRLPLFPGVISNIADKWLILYVILGVETW